ncbi:MAG: VCBS repeat-containing protein [Verrucomicrobia bacterium]|nr:VCBS repeat-containing protein [Verrucomicrobiota bacterium]
MKSATSFPPVVPAPKSRRAKVGSLKPLIAVLTLAFAPASLEVVSAQQIQFRPGTLLQAAGHSLNVGSYAIPCVADWNGDGRKDLLVGYQTASKIVLYLNTGSDASPAFTTSVTLQAGGTDINLPSGGCGAPVPFVCDYDNDGKRDLLVGDGANGYVYFYRNTNTDANPILDTGVRLMVGGSPLTVGIRASPYVCDWNGDGLKDLLCGNGNGNVYFFKNIGTAQSPEYVPGTLIQAGGANLSLGIRSVVRMFDLDGDGVADLLGSSDSGVYWCRNTGSSVAPVLALPVALRTPVSGSGLRPIYTGPRMRLDWVDWNNDGVMDLLLGNADGTVSFYEGYRFCFTTIAPQPAGERALQWKSADYLSYRVLAGPSAESITNLVATNLPSGGKTTSWTNSSSADREFYRLQIAP